MVVYPARTTWNHGTSEWNTHGTSELYSILNDLMAKSSNLSWPFYPSSISTVSCIFPGCFQEPKHPNVDKCSVKTHQRPQNPPPARHSPPWEVSEAAASIGALPAVHRLRNGHSRPRLRSGFGKWVELRLQPGKVDRNPTDSLSNIGSCWICSMIF